MILSDKQILKQIDKGNIVIDPFYIENLGPNSYDLHLSGFIKLYKNNGLDSKGKNETFECRIDEKKGMVLEPNKVYLASTVEYTETHNLVPILHGKSSIGRLGLFIHVTAGFGDNGFCGHWTLELVATQPILIYPLMPIAQIAYFKTGKGTKYYERKSSKYMYQGEEPVASKNYLNYVRGKN